jgi:methyltransferase-like protein
VEAALLAPEAKLQSDAHARRRLAANLLKLYSANAVEVHSIPSAFVTSISGRPLTTSLVRLQAAHGGRVTNLRHESLPVNDVERAVLSLLDGTRGRAEIVKELAAAVESGKLLLKRDGTAVTDPAERAAQLGRLYDQLLPQFAGKALLVA